MAKIIQIVSTHEGEILGLDDDGVVYSNNYGGWVQVIKPLESKEVKALVKKKKFEVPYRLDVSEYMIEIHLKLGEAETESEKFCDFYASKDWMVGKNKMKDWKAAARNWLKNYKPSTSLNMDNTDWINDVGKIL